MNDTTLKDGSLAKKELIGWIVAVALFVVVMLIPTTELFTAQIRLSIALTAAIMSGFAFEILPNVVLGLMLLTLYIVTNLADASVALSGFTNPNVWSAAAAMLLVGCMDQTRVLKKACYGCMLKLGGSYRAIVIAMSIVAIALGAVIGGANVAAPMIVIAYALCVALGLEPGSNEAALLMVSSYVAANAPTAYFYSSLQAMGYSAMAKAIPDAPAITYGSYLYHNWPMIIFGFITIAIVMVCFPVTQRGKEAKAAKAAAKETSKKYLASELDKVGKMQTKDYIMVGILALVLIGLLTMTKTKLNIAWILMIGALICYLPFIRIGNGEALRSVKWAVFIFMGATMGIGAVFSAVGTSDFLASIVQPMLTSVGTTLCMFFVWLIATIANFFLTPLASINTLLPAIANITSGMGIPSTPVFYMFMQGATNTCVLPYEIAMPMLMFSYGLVSLKQFVKAMGLITIANAVFLMVIMVPYWHLIGLI